MPKVSVVIPTHNRPDLVVKAIGSVLNQTHQDFEIIVVDDGMEKRAEAAVSRISDPRVRYIAHGSNRGGGAARNTGIRAAVGEYIAFLDDDDQWLPEKLGIQRAELEKSPDDAGFCFSAVSNAYSDRQEISMVKEGRGDYHEASLRSFKGMLTVTLVIGRKVFDRVGFFDEQLPSHQEAELMIRVTRQFKGIGINRPLVKVNMDAAHDQVGRSLNRRIKGREMVLAKHKEEFQARPEILARHYFQLGIWYRDTADKKMARHYFRKALAFKFEPIYFFHLIKNFL